MRRTLVEYDVASNGDKHKVIKAEVYYSKGGYNYSSYKTDPRGYWLSVIPETRWKGGGVSVTQWTGGSGFKVFLQEAKRYSAKAFERAFSAGMQRLEDDELMREVSAMRNKVLAEVTA